MCVGLLRCLLLAASRLRGAPPLKVFTVASPRPGHPDISIINETMHALYYHYPSWGQYDSYIVLDGCPQDHKYWESAWCDAYGQFVQRLEHEIHRNIVLRHVRLIPPVSWKSRVGLAGTIQRAFQYANVGRNDLVLIQQSDTRFASGEIHLADVATDIYKMPVPYVRMLRSGIVASDPCRFYDHNHFCLGRVYYDNVFPGLVLRPGVAPEDLYTAVIPCAQVRSTSSGGPMVDHLDGMNSYPRPHPWARPVRWKHVYFLEDNKLQRIKHDALEQLAPSAGTRLHAVILVRIYKDDPPGWSRYELSQWIQYMTYAGVSTIYLYDAHISEAESLRGFAAKWDTVVYHDWGIFNHPYSIAGTQVRAYQHAIDTYGHLSDWQLAFDVDEYPFSPIDLQRGFLVRQVAKLAGTASELSLKNYVFLGKHCAGPERVIDRIVRRTPKEANNLDKPIYRPGHVRAQVHHNFMLPGKVSVDVDPRVLRTNHYWGLRLQNWGKCKAGQSGCWSTQQMLDKTVEDTSARVIAHTLDGKHPKWHHEI
jgi:hypothetical protein